MQPCWYELAAGGEQGMLRFSLSEETTNKHVKSTVTVFIEHVASLLQCPFKCNGQNMLQSKFNSSWSNAFYMSDYFTTVQNEQILTVNVFQHQ